MEEPTVETKPEYEFDFNSMPVTKNLNSLHQEGNFLVGVTEMGIKFKQRIPTDKMLSKNQSGDWVLIPLRGVDIK